MRNPGKEVGSKVFSRKAPNGLMQKRSLFKARPKRQTVRVSLSLTLRNARREIEKDHHWKRPM